MKIKKYLQASPLYSINNVYEMTLAELNKSLKAEEINFVQGLILVSIFLEEKGEVSPSLIAKSFQTSPSNISHALSHLEEKRWIRRVANPKDARKFLIEIKPDGAKKASRLIRFFNFIQDQFEDEFGERKIEVICRDIQMFPHKVEKIIKTYNTQ